MVPPDIKKEGPRRGGDWRGPGYGIGLQEIYLTGYEASGQSGRYRTNRLIRRRYLYRR